METVVSQMNLFEVEREQARGALLEAGIRAASLAVERARMNANPEWAAVAYHHGVLMARAFARFTSADIDLEMMQVRPDLTTHDKRAMGSVIRRLCANGVVRLTDTVEKDPRPNCHAQNKRVLRSLIWEATWEGSATEILTDETHATATAHADQETQIDSEAGRTYCH